MDSKLKLFSRTARSGPKSNTVLTRVALGARKQKIEDQATTLPYAQKQDILLMLRQEWEQLQKEKLNITKSAHDLLGSSSFRVQSRDDYYKARVAKDKIPPTGYYNVNYDLIEPKSKIPKLYPLHKSKSNQTLQPQSEINPTLNQVKLPNVINFEKMLERRPFVQKDGIPHDKRFVTRNLYPKNWSNTKVQPSPSFDHYMPRDGKMFRGPEFNPQYNPQKEKFMKNLGKCLSFDSMVSRDKFYSIPESPAGYDKNYSFTEKKQTISSQRSVRLDKNLPREADPTSGLPSFMQIKSGRLGKREQPLSSYKPDSSYQQSMMSSKFLDLYADF